MFVQLQTNICRLVLSSMLICFVFWCYFVIYAWLTFVFFGLQTTAVPDSTTHAVGNVNNQKPIGITETSYMILGASFTRPRLQHKNFAVLALCTGNPTMIGKYSAHEPNNTKKFHTTQPSLSWICNKNPFRPASQLREYTWNIWWKKSLWALHGSSGNSYN